MLWSDPFVPLAAQLARPAAFLPATDVAVSGDDLLLTLDVPGLAAEDLSIEVLGDSLFIRGERRHPHTADGTTFAHVERPFGTFERRIRVPDGVDADRIMASLDNGVLSLIVPKPERMKPKAITIAGGAEQRQLETADA